MNWKKQQLKKSRLYIVLDKDLVGEDSVIKIAARIKKAGVDIVQFRDKTSDRKTFLNTASKLKELFQNSKTLFIINDNADVALAVDSDGLHLGQQDLPIEAARRILGNEKIIGISCSTLEQAMKAQSAGADYLGFGPVFATQTKTIAGLADKNLLPLFKKRLTIPFFAIGGINAQNYKKLSLLGVNRIAVSSAVCLSESIGQSVDRLTKQILKHDPN